MWQLKSLVSPSSLLKTARRFVSLQQFFLVTEWRGWGGGREIESEWSWGAGELGEERRARRADPPPRL